MSPPDSADKRPGISVPKAKNDIYTVMLGIALLAIIIACILLWMEMARYEYKFKVSRLVSPAPAAAQHVATDAPVAHAPLSALNAV